jgi:serine/threonine-protein kinase
VIGQRINNYEIVAQIGEGGMGAVYLARHPFIDRKAAIKVLRAGLAADQTLVGRFFNEARAATAIRHPNIIDVFDVGVIPGTSTPYLMMELLEGESLAKRLKRAGRIRVGDAVEFAFQTASALAAAHKKGIIHRDLKPENLFLVGDPNVPGREIVKVLDFGIAKLRGDFGPPSSGGEVKTQTGTLMGTPPYMSPEQCRGVSSQIDQRTDVYALGIILYEMLCGTPPFTGLGFGDILVAHLTQEPPPPRSLNAGIPEHLERSILKALAKKAEDRFASMTDFQSALGAGPARTEAYVTASGVERTPAPAAGALPREEQISSPSASVRAPAAFESVSAVHAVGREPEAAAEPVPQNTTTFSASAGQMVAAGEDGGGDAEGDVDLAPPRSRRGALLVGGGVAAAAAGVALFVAFGGGPGKTVGSGGPAGAVARPASPAAPVAAPPRPLAPAPAPSPAPAPPAPAPPAPSPAAAPAPAPAAAKRPDPNPAEPKPSRKSGKAEKADKKAKAPAEEPYRPLKL